MSKKDNKPIQDVAKSSCLELLSLLEVLSSWCMWYCWPEGPDNIDSSARLIDRAQIAHSYHHNIAPQTSLYTLYCAGIYWVQSREKRDGRRWVIMWRVLSSMGWGHGLVGQGDNCSQSEIPYYLLPAIIIPHYGAGVSYLCLAHSTFSKIHFLLSKCF